MVIVREGVEEISLFPKFFKLYFSINDVLGGGSNANAVPSL